MYEICKNVINSGRYELSAMLRKLDVLWMQSQLNDEQKAELEKLVREHADPRMSENLAAEIDELRKRVEKLETDSGGGSADTVPEYIEGMRYRRGDHVIFEGMHYQCIAPEGQICTWSPSDYPDYWKAA